MGTAGGENDAARWRLRPPFRLAARLRAHSRAPIGT